ncbi:MAG: hypothetical protein PVJ57_15850 [Phycisphaerae bacterium]|jgi:hypothetical protein
MASASSKTSVASKTSGDTSRLAALERRLAEAERKLALVWGSSLGIQLRMMEASERTRLQEAAAERAAAQRRVDAADARAEVFARFVGERVAIHHSLHVSAERLRRDFSLWCEQNRVGQLHRILTDDELEECVTRALPAAEPASVHPEGYLGRPIPLVPGFAGVGCCPPGRTPAEVASRLDRRAAADETERRLRREELEAEAEVQRSIIAAKTARDRAAELAVQAAEGRVRR